MNTPYMYTRERLPWTVFVAGVHMDAAHLPEYLSGIFSAFISA